MVNNKHEQQIYKYAEELFFGYLFKKTPISIIEQLEEPYIRVSGIGFLESMCKDNGFSSLDDAKEFGDFMVEYYNEHKKLPNKVPRKKFLEKILKLNEQ